MLNLENEVFDVIKHALNKIPYQKSLSNEIDIYKIIFENGLNGLAYSVIDKNHVSEQFYKHLEKTFFEYVSKDQKQLGAIDEIKNILNKHEIDYIFMKGSILKHIYPESYMRAMGDIDILVKEEDLDKVHQAFYEHQIKCSFKSKQHDGFLYNHLMIEVHPGLYKDFNPKYEKLFSNPWEYAKHIQDHEYRFTHEYEICYLLYHLAKHMDSSGVGLRSILDLGLYARYYENEINHQQLEDLLKEAKMNAFYHAMMEFNLKCFDVSYETNTIETRLSENDMHDLIKYITKSGIHGLGSDYNPFSTRVASHELRQKSKTAFIISLIFPKTETMLGMYPWIKKAKILIIPAWVFRWFRLLFKKTKMTFHNIKRLKTKEIDVEESKHIFKMIGLE